MWTMSKTKNALLATFVLLTLGTAIISCVKDAHTIPSPELSAASSNDIRVIDGRLVFNDSNQFREIYHGLIGGKDLSISSDKFTSYNDLYLEVGLVDMSDDEFQKFVKSDVYNKLFHTEIDQDGIKSAEPNLASPNMRKVLNSDMEFQIKDFVYKHESSYIYKVPADAFDRATFKSNAIEIRSAEKKRTARGEQVLHDCTRFFLSKNGHWTRKMQGKIMQLDIFPTNEVEIAVTTRSRKKTTFGWWRGTRDYSITLDGIVAVTTGGIPFLEYTNVYETCGGCADVLENGIIGQEFSLATHVVFSLDCGGDCAKESPNGIVSCALP